MREIKASDLVKVLNKGGKILGEDSDEKLEKLLRPLIAEIGNIANRDAPKVKVNMDLEEVAAALNTLAKVLDKPQPKGQRVDLSPVVRQLESVNKKHAYEFDIERDDRGRINKVKANPVEVN